MRTTSDTELASSLRLALARTARRLRQEAGTGLSPSLTAALATVERCGPLTPSELAGLERVARPTVTRVLIRLEEAGLISRTPDPADRRSTLVAITPAGAALLAEARTRKDAFLSERLDGLSPADRATLARAAAILEGLLE
ncbi:MAG TPA: MarR family transcriptional regulator [Solirubrobacteraceae bacterium]|nr:MarR family transcriptional regulator [Solirubrobacteraceae bacterium]